MKPYVSKDFQRFPGAKLKMHRNHSTNSVKVLRNIWFQRFSGAKFFFNEFFNEFFNGFFNGGTGGGVSGGVFGRALGLV